MMCDKERSTVANIRLWSLLEGNEWEVMESVKREKKRFYAIWEYTCLGGAAEHRKTTLCICRPDNTSKIKYAFKIFQDKEDFDEHKPKQCKEKGKNGWKWKEEELLTNHNLHDGSHDLNRCNDQGKWKATW